MFLFLFITTQVNPFPAKGIKPKAENAINFKRHNVLFLAYWIIPVKTPRGRRKKLSVCL